MAHTPRRRRLRALASRSSGQLALPGIARHDRMVRHATAEARRRKGGRPRTPEGQRNVDHTTRPTLLSKHPVHVTLKLAHGLPSLRSRAGWRVARKVLLAAAHRFGQMFRVVEFSVQSNHVHMLVEAENRRELARGMQGLGIRLAKNLNLALRRGGRVLADRYHARILTDLVQTRRALAYVRQNQHLHRWRNHERTSWLPDSCSTDHPELLEPMPACTTWLVRRARAELPPPMI